MEEEDDDDESECADNMVKMTARTIRLTVVTKIRMAIRLVKGTMCQIWPVF